MSNAAVATAPAPAAPKENPTVMPHRFHDAKSVRNLWRAVVEPGHTRSHVEEPGYWVHSARKLQPGDLIEVLAEDGKFYGQLFVRSSDRAGAKVAVLAWHEFDAAEAPQGKFKTEWKGHVKKHCVVRASDGTVIQDGFGTKEDAVKWLDENKASLSA